MTRSGLCSRKRSHAGVPTATSALVNRSAPETRALPKSTKRATPAPLTPPAAELDDLTDVAPAAAPASR